MSNGSQYAVMQRVRKSALPQSDKDYIVGLIDDDIRIGPGLREYLRGTNIDEGRDRSREYPKVHVEGRGSIDNVGHQPDNRNACGRCGSKDIRVLNHSMMWHDGDIVCAQCGGYVRMFDAG